MEEHNLIGVDKKSAEYTVMLGNVTMTADDDIKVYMVDEDDNITASSYNAIRKADANKAYYQNGKLPRNLEVEQCPQERATEHCFSIALLQRYDSRGAHRRKKLA